MSPGTEPPAPDVQRVRGATLCVGINEDHSITAVVGTWNRTTHRYTFVQLPPSLAIDLGEQDLGAALMWCARQAALDPEARMGAY